MRVLRRDGNVVWVGARGAAAGRPLPPPRPRRERGFDALLVWLAHDRAHLR